MVSAAFLDLLRRHHGLLNAIVDVEAVAIAAGVAGRLDVVWHQRVVPPYRIGLRSGRLKAKRLPPKQTRI